MGAANFHAKIITEGGVPMDPMWIVLGLLVLLVLAYILLFNRLNRLRVKVD